MPRDLLTVYHLVDTRNYASIRKYGLLSAQRLQERTDIATPEMIAHWRQHRAKSVMLPDGTVLRDQRPMPPNALRRCLDPGLEPEDWYELLNGKVFFWTDHDRLNRQRRACGGTEQIALTIDAAALLHHYGNVAGVSPINSGNAMRAAARRGRSTFVPYRLWQAEGWRSERQDGSPPRLPNHPPAELVIPGAVPDVLAYVRSETRLGAGEFLIPDLASRPGR